LQVTNQDFLTLFLASFLITALLTPVMRRIALYFGVTDKPNQAHKTHKEPVPYLGGLAIVIGVVVVTYGATTLSDFTSKDFLLATTVLVPALMMAAIGLVDDLRQLSPLPRFIVQNMIALVATTVLISTNTLGSPFGLLALDFIVSVFWLVGITNAVNFFDNVDGGASGTVAISSLALAAIAFSSGQFLIASFSIVISGTTIAFLIWNKSPARIYMGDSGALFLGILLASLTIRVDSEAEIGKFGLVIPIFLMAIPILDTSVAVTKRIKVGTSPFKGGRDHLSHRLMRQGLTKRQTVFILWGLSALFAFLAIVLVQADSNIRFISVLFGLLFWLGLFVFFFNTSDTE